MKQLFFIGACILLTANTYSQKHQISAGMGIGSSNQLLDVFETSLTYIFNPNASLNQSSELGEFRIAYAYAPKERWRYGGAFSYSQTNFDVNYNQEKVGEQVNSYYTLAAETSFTYLKKEKFNMYALIGAGATFRNSKQTKYSSKENDVEFNDTLFNFQITPLGASYGLDWGAFAELGFGYRGVLSFGVFYNF